MKLMMTLIALSSFSAMAGNLISVPAKNILIASRSIISQSAPFYRVSGKIGCSITSTGWSPATSSCEIEIQGRTVSVKNPDAIIEAVLKVRPMTGPRYHFSANFNATSVSSEIPPYKVSERADVILEVK